MTEDGQAGGLQAGTATAVEQGREVAGTTKDAATEVAHATVEQVKELAGSASDEVIDLTRQLRAEVRDKAQAETELVAERLRSLAGQFQALVEGRTAEAGELPKYARQLSTRLQRFASELAESGPQGAMESAEGLARRRPGRFLAGAAAAGFAAGRLFRTAQSTATTPSDSPSGAGSGSATPLRPQSPPQPPVPLMVGSPGTEDGRSGGVATVDVAGLERRETAR